MCDAISCILEALKFSPSITKDIFSIADRLNFGVDQQGLAFTRLDIKGLNRVHIRRLLENGFTTPDSLNKISTEALGGIIKNKEIAKLLKEKVDGGGTGFQPVENLTGKMPVPPSETEVTLHFTAKIKGKRTSILLNDKELFLPPALFVMLFILAIKAKKGKDVWVHHLSIKSMNARTAGARLKKVSGLGALIQNNGHGSFRLAIPPNNIGFNLKELKNHWDTRITSLIPELLSL